MRSSAIALAVAFIAGGALAHDGFSTAEECSGRHVRFSDEPAYVKKEVIDASSLRSIKASVTNAPISIEGGNATGYTITVCKAAEVESDLDRISVTLDGNELRSKGPSHNRWTVLYHVHTPRGADVDVSAENGPVSVRDFEGTLLARALNGPLSLKNVEGNVDASTTNGPITIDGGSGTMKVKAMNGPLAVDLDGAAWNGTLDASTRNGPLSVTVPRNFGSGVVVESRGRGPISCRAAGCERAWRSDDDGEPRRLELGSGAVNVHLSTVNGPITVRDE